jgi:hypothetical protein
VKSGALPETEVDEYVTVREEELGVGEDCVNEYAAQMAIMMIIGMAIFSVLLNL